MEAATGILIHLVVPAIGLLAFLKICRDIRKKEIPHQPYFPIFALFFGYGGWLIIFLTLLFWYWSGMAILGFFFLLFVMPLVIFGCIAWLYTKPDVSKYHKYALKGSYWYLALTALIWIALLLNSGPARR